MKAIPHFIRTTILGGVLFLTPIVALTVVLNKAFDIARQALKPLAALVPPRRLFRSDYYGGFSDLRSRVYLLPGGPTGANDARPKGRRRTGARAPLEAAGL